MTGQLRRVVDGAVLGIRLDPSLDDGLRQSVVRSLAGHPAAHRLAQVQAWLSVAGSGPVVLQGDHPDLPYASSTGCGPDYALYAVGEWLEAASLRLGRPDAVRLHAAAFVDGPRTWVVAGASGAGKTTLALEALGRGARYLTEERVTILRGPPIRVAGVARALRARPEPAGGFAPGERDAFRSLVFLHACEVAELDSRDAAVAPTDLILLHDDPPAAPSAGWVLRALVELALNAQEVGATALVDLADLLAATRVHVVRTRTIASVVELVGRRGIGPTLPPELLDIRAPTTSPYAGLNRVAPGVVTMAMGEDLVLWAPGPPARVVHLADAGAHWWRRVLAGERPDPLAEGMPVMAQLEQAAFVGGLTDLGALTREARS